MARGTRRTGSVVSGSGGIKARKSDPSGLKGRGTPTQKRALKRRKSWVGGLVRR